MKKQKIIFFLFILVGLGILNYPYISQWVNQKNESQVIYTYDQAVDKLTDTERKQLLAEAAAYNQTLLQQGQELKDGFQEKDEPEKQEQGDKDYEEYESLLDPSGDGIMGYLEIPAIEVFLPVYHGTKEKVLEQGAGHLFGSSLPVGGTGTHAVIAAHTGLSSRILFTDLDQLKKGDVFFLNMLGEKLAYQIDQIETVLPDRTDLLEIEKDKDYVTLVTCTPYGINSHRLLVRGERIPYSESVQTQKEKESASGFLIWGRRFFWLSLLILLVAGVLLLKPGKRKVEKK